jgi:hypothetical protein
MTRSGAILVIAVLTWTVTVRAQPTLTLETVIQRASRFAEQQRDALSKVRADEKYVQWTEADARQVFERRTLLSEMAFVRLTDREDWVAFRNVVRVDDKPTGTDPARLERLFRDGAPAGQFDRIVRESALHNLGGLERTLNTPVIVMHLLMPAQVDRFKFKKEGEESRASGRAWVVSLHESQRPTIVRSSAHDDVPIRGRMWIVAETGALLRATLDMDRPVKTQLEFSWRRDEKLDAWVPEEMRERYMMVRPNLKRRLYDIVGIATYSNFRRFEVDVRIK